MAPNQPGNCARCGGITWVVDPGLATQEYPLGRATRCPECYNPATDTHRLKVMESIFPLTEIERGYRFKNFIPNAGSKTAAQHVGNAVRRGYGMILLYGMHGLGKTRLLITAANEVRQTSTAIFTTVEALFRYLRTGFDPDRPGQELNYDRRWELIRNADLLALDELEKYNPTNWAAAQFQELIDYRWRNITTKITLGAMNGNWEHDLDPAIADRFSDGRAEIIETSGRSFRPSQHWSDK